MPLPRHRLPSLVVPLLALGIVTAAVAHGARSRAAGGTPRPNVVLIVTDDQGWADLGCHGNPHVRTPNLDRLAREGVEFTRFYVSPVCTPTRASLMTGRWNYRTGAVDTYLGRAMMHADERTVAEELSAAGYITGIFGKWHLGDNHPLRPMDQGFAHSLVHRGGGIGQPADPPHNAYFDPVLLRNGKEERTEGYCTDVFADAAIRFIEQHRERPFFAYFATNAPHVPLEVAEGAIAPYRKMGLDEVTARTYAMIENVDHNVGKLLGCLRRLRLEERTFVLFLCDNGGHAPASSPRFDGGLRGRKGSVYEGGIRSPLFLRRPGTLTAGRKVDRIAAHVDLFPTLLEACGVPLPKGVRLDGRSLMPLLRGARAGWPDRTLFFQWHRGDEPVLHRAWAAVGQQYKLVQNTESAPVELYDLERDPGERRNIALDQAQEAARLRREYEGWFRDVSATRGYDPPRIHLGAAPENPVTLTRQDWRGPEAGWGPMSLGHWEVQTVRAGRYRVTLRFPQPQGGGEAGFRIAGVERRVDLAVAGGTFCTFTDVELPAGRSRLEAWVTSGGRRAGVHYVDVRRISP